MPRIRVKTDTVYTYDELSDEAKDRAVEALWDLNVDDEWWWSFVKDDIEELGKISGLGCEYGGSFDLERGRHIHIRGLCTTVSGLLGNVEQASANYPNVGKEVLAPFVGSFTKREIKNLLTLEKLDLLGSMTGETSTDRHGPRWEVENGARRADLYPRTTRLIEKLEDTWERLVMDLEHCYVSMLEAEWDYRTSREAIIESIEANEYEFTEKGKPV